MPPREPDPILVRILEALQSIDARLSIVEKGHAKIEREEAIIKRLGDAAADLSEWLKGQQAAALKIQAERAEGRSALLDVLRQPGIKELLIIALSALATWGGMRYGAPQAAAPAAAAATLSPPGGADASTPPH